MNNIGNLTTAKLDGLSNNSEFLGVVDTETQQKDLTNSQQNKIILNNSGKLILIFGPMFSGKTTAMIDMIIKLKLKDSSAKICIVKHSLDVRYLETGS